MEQQAQQSRDDEDFIVNDSGFVEPPVGLHRAVCVDIFKIIVKSPFKLDAKGAPEPQEKISIVWELDKLMEDGRPYIANELYTPSLHVKAKMRAHLESWRGKPFTTEECKRFNVIAVLGAPCQLLIQVPPEAKRTRVVSIIKPTEPFLKASGSYIRKKDRPAKDVNTSMAEHIPGAAATTATVTAAADRPPF